MCLFGTFQYGWLKGFISIAHIFIIQSEVTTFPNVIIFFRGCVPEMFVTSYCVNYCIYVPRKPGICFHYYCGVYDECKKSDTFWFAGRIQLFVQYTISLSSLCKLIWRHWTYKKPVRLNIFSVIHYTICVYSVCPFPLWWLREYIYICTCLIIIIKSEVWTITNCLELGHKIMVCAALELKTEWGQV